MSARAVRCRVLLATVAVGREPGFRAGARYGPGRVFNSWLYTINDTDRASLEEWMDRHMPGTPVEQGHAGHAFR